MNLPLHPLVAGPLLAALDPNLTGLVALAALVLAALLAHRLGSLGRTVRELQARLAEAKPADRSAPVAVPAPPATNSAAADHPAVEAGIDDEALVVIAATVAAVWGPSARLVSVGEARGVRLWALEGRRQIFASHQIR